MPDDTCPVCGEEYDMSTSLSSRHGRQIDVSDYDRVCQDAVRRSGGSRAAKPTRSDTERYRFVGYFHA